MQKRENLLINYNRPNVKWINIISSNSLVELKLPARWHKLIWSFEFKIFSCKNVMRFKNAKHIVYYHLLSTKIYDDRKLTPTNQSLISRAYKVQTLPFMKRKNDSENGIYSTLFVVTTVFCNKIWVIQENINGIRYTFQYLIISQLKSYLTINFWIRNYISTRESAVLRAVVLYIFLLIPPHHHMIGINILFFH